LAALLQSIKDEKGATLFHTVGYNINTINQILLASTFSNVDHIKAIQKDAMTFLHTYYPWLMAPDVFEQLESTTVLMKQINDLNITQVAQAGKIIEELFLDWDECPSLSEDEVAGPALKENTSRVHDRGPGNMVHLPLIPNHNINSQSAQDPLKRRQRPQQQKYSVTVS
jgi:hypothetical protein